MQWYEVMLVVTWLSFLAEKNGTKSPQATKVKFKILSTCVPNVPDLCPVIRGECAIITSILYVFLKLKNYNHVLKFFEKVYFQSFSVTYELISPYLHINVEKRYFCFA